MTPRPAHGCVRRTAARSLVGIVAAALGVFAQPAAGQAALEQPPEEVQGVDVTEKLGERVPGGLRFTNDRGELVDLAEATFDGEKPAILALVYYDCPIVCSVVLDRLSNTLNELDYGVGDDLNVAVVSFDHHEGVTEAAGKAQRYRDGYLAVRDDADAATVERGWGFYVGEEDQVRQLADAVGYGYKRLPNGEYSHPVAIMVLSPEGVVTRYIYGFDYPVDQVKLSLLDASEGRIAQSLGDVFQFFCFPYDPATGRYSANAMAIMRVAGVLTIIGIVLLITLLGLGERARRRIKTVSQRRREARELALREGGGAEAAKDPSAPPRRPAPVIIQADTFRTSAAAGAANSGA